MKYTSSITHHQSRIIRRASQIMMMILSLFLMASSVSAATIFEEPRSVFVPPGQKFLVIFYLSTDQDVNAIQARIRFPKELLQLDEIRDGTSLVSFWVDRPTLESDGTVLFSGIIPNGFSGKKGPMIALVFHAVKEGKSSILMDSIKLLRNDGQGSEEPVTAQKLPFIISSAAPATSSLLDAQLSDTEPPEPFFIQFARDPSIADGRLVALFSTVDKGGGVDHYEGFESTRAVDVVSVDPQRWKAILSPYIMDDQTEGGYLYVRAVDKAGNRRLSVREPFRPRLFNQFWLYGILFLILACVLFVWRTRRARKNTE